MAKDKKSFVLYADWMGAFDHLSDKEAGILIKHIFQYVNDLNPELDNRFLKLAFEPIKQSLKRDLKKWEQERGNRSEAGKKGMASRWGKRENITGDNKNNSVINPITKITDNVSVSVNVNDSVNVKNKREGFAPPAKEDVVALMWEKLDEFSAMGEADKFINFYQSKNWYVGKTKMKDWKAAARGWISRMNDFKNEKNGQRKQGTSEARVEALKNF